MKIVVNKCFGGFELSEVAYEELGLEWDGYGDKYSGHGDRTRPELVACVEKLGNKASGKYARLRIVDVPDDVVWEITEYNGHERVEEVHRYW